MRQTSRSKGQDYSRRRRTANLLYLT